MAPAASRWRDSNVLFVLAALFVPPLAIPLLLLRPEKGSTKVLGCVVLLLMTGVYARTATRIQWPQPSGPPEAHWDALEAHRRAQAKRARGGEDVRAAAAPASTGRYWTSFRGPGAAGRYDEMPVVDDWPSAGLPLLWKQPIGQGWSSFAVADGVAYTLERRRAQEVVAAYDVASGRELWSESWKSSFSESADRDGPRATPVWDEGRVYALGAAGDLVALEAASGRRLWRRDILRENDAANIQWGVAASPVVIGDVVVTMPGGPEGRAVVAYDKLTGEPRWSALSDAVAYTTPMLLTLAGREQLLVVTATRAVGLDPLDGGLLWEHPWATDMGVNAAQPIVVGTDRFILSAGYGHGAALVEVAAAGDAFTTRAVWETNRMKNKLSSSVYHDGHLYGLDEGILACIDVATGDLRWKGGRYGHGQLLLVQGALVVLTEDGELALVEAVPEAFVERARFAALDGQTWNNPAISSGILLVRNSREMAAYRIGAAGAAGASA